MLAAVVVVALTSPTAAADRLAPTGGGPGRTATAALGSLLALILGVSRTTFAMARDRDLPGALDVVHPRYEVPHRAELAVGLLVAVLTATVDLRGAIGFSSFGVLLYYAIANAAALTLRRGRAGPSRSWGWPAASSSPSPSPGPRCSPAPPSSPSAPWSTGSSSGCVRVTHWR